jgi:hypothetical protein
MKTQKCNIYHADLTWWTCHHFSLLCHKIECSGRHSSPRGHKIECFGHHFSPIGHKIEYFGHHFSRL